MMKAIAPDDLIPLNIFSDDYPLSINLIYTQKDHPHNHFDQLYHPGASLLWLHKDMAKLVLLASHILYDRTGWILECIDGLRPVEAQDVMVTFGYPEEMIAPAGVGGHPRGMAIDVHPRGADGQYIDMGTAFDDFSPASARDYPHSDDVRQNRQELEDAMMRAAGYFKLPLWPLPSEWWDFRFQPSYSEEFAPFYEGDLLPCQRLINLDPDACDLIKIGRYPPAMARNIETLRYEISDDISLLSKI